MDFGRILSVVARHKIKIATSVVVSSGLVFGVTRQLPGSWTASVSLTTPVQPSQPDEPRSEEGPGSGGSAVKVFAAMVRSKQVIEGAAREAAVDEPIKNLVARVQLEAAGQRMFELKYTDPNLGRARAMANAIADHLVKANRNHNSTEAQRTIDLLERQLKEVETDLHSFQARYDRFCTQNQIVPGDFLNEVRSLTTSIETARAASEAAVARIAQTRAKMEALAAMPTAAKQSLPGTIVVQGGPDEELAQQLTDLDAEIADLKQRYNDQNPVLVDKQKQREKLVKKLSAVRQRPQQAPAASMASSAPSTAGAPSTLSIAALREAIVADEVLIRTQQASIAARQKELARIRQANSLVADLAAKISDRTETRNAISVRLNRAKTALDFAERQNPIVILEYSGDTNPPKDGAAGRTGKFVGMAALFALLLSSGAAIFVDSTDRRIKSVKQAETVLPAATLAVIPDDDGRSRAIGHCIAVLDSDGLRGEAYRFLGRRILSPALRANRVLMALSAKQGQGSTGTMANLAVVLAQAGYRVLLVDANFRNPMLHNVFRVSEEPGFSDLLQSDSSPGVSLVAQASGTPGLRIVTAGAAPANVWQILGAERLRVVAEALREEADFVLFDTPAALKYTDALSIAAVCDGALLCVDASKPLSGAEMRLADVVTTTAMPILGSVLVDAPSSVSESYDNSQMPTLPPTDTERLPAIASLQAGADDNRKSDLTGRAGYGRASTKSGARRTLRPGHGRIRTKLRDD